MNFYDKKPVVVLEHETALKVYLDALLQDMSHAAFADEPESALAQQVILENNIRKPVAVTHELSAQPAIHACQQQASAMPAWAETSFQCLLVRTNGVKLAVPLVKLNSIFNLTEPVHPVPGYSPWFMGLLSWRGTHIKIIDLLKLMGMEGGDFTDSDKSANKRVLLINDGIWGFVCDDVSKIITLYPEQIKWRTDRTRRAWLAGTLIEHMCSLLDVDQFSIPARIMHAN